MAATDTLKFEPPPPPHSSGHCELPSNPSATARKSPASACGSLCFASRQLKTTSILGQASMQFIVQCHAAHLQRHGSCQQWQQCPLLQLVVQDWCVAVASRSHCQSAGGISQCNRQRHLGDALHHASNADAAGQQLICNLRENNTQVYMECLANQANLLDTTRLKTYRLSCLSSWSPSMETCAAWQRVPKPDPHYASFQTMNLANMCHATGLQFLSCHIRCI